MLLCFCHTPGFADEADEIRKLADQSAHSESRERSRFTALFSVQKLSSTAAV
jgi:hypothetical protein